MCGISDNARCEINPEIEIDNDFSVGLGSDPAVSMPMAATVASAVMVGVDDPGLGFFVSSAYVEVVCWRSS